MVSSAGRIQAVAVMALMMGATTALHGCGKSSAARDGAVTIDASPDGGPSTTDGAPDNVSPGTDTPPDLPGTDAGLPLAQLCPAVTAALCAYGMQCTGWEYRDPAHCMAEVACLGVVDFTSSVANGAVIYDPVEAARCLARFQSDPCHFSNFLTVPDAFEILSRCPGALTPAVGAGGACVTSEECTAGLYCKTPRLGGSALCPGQCTAVPKAGESCMNAPCAPGLYCLAQMCRPYAHAQDACTSNGECFIDPTITARLWCDLGSNTCKPPVAEGGVCGIKTPGSGDSSMQIPCAPGLWCDALFIDQRGVCRKPGGAGTPCGYELAACTTGFHCVGYEPNVKLGTCAGPAAAGGACNFREDCVSGLFCIDNLCGGPSPVGGACNGFSGNCQQGLACDPADFNCRQPRYPGDACGDPGGFCQGSICRDGHCVDFAAIGEPCVYGNDCQWGLSCAREVCRDSSICASL